MIDKINFIKLAPLVIGLVQEIHKLKKLIFIQDPYVEYILNLLYIG